MDIGDFKENTKIVFIRPFGMYGENKDISLLNNAYVKGTVLSPTKIELDTPIFLKINGEFVQKKTLISGEGIGLNDYKMVDVTAPVNIGGHVFHINDRIRFKTPFNMFENNPPEQEKRIKINTIDGTIIEFYPTKVKLDKPVLINGISTDTIDEDTSNFSDYAPEPITYGGKCRRTKSAKRKSSRRRRRSGRRHRKTRR